jgi:hypothetical protein
MWQDDFLGFLLYLLPNVDTLVRLGWSSGIIWRWCLLLYFSYFISHHTSMIAIYARLGTGAYKRNTLSMINHLAEYHKANAVMVLCCTPQKKTDLSSMHIRFILFAMRRQSLNPGELKKKQKKKPAMPGNQICVNVINVVEQRGAMRPGGEVNHNQAAHERQCCLMRCIHM